MTADCLCGGVRIEITGKLGALVYCHCSRCRKAQGTAFGANADVRRTYWRWLGGEDLIREFESSPGVFRAFCSRCGSSIYSRRPDAPDVLRIRLGILNDDPERRSLAHFHVASKAPWYEIADGLPQFAQGPADHADEIAAGAGRGRRMDEASAGRFAAEWVAAWNAHDLDRILAHYDDDFEMSSPVIVALLGDPSGRLRGKPAIRAYWTKALASAPDLHFELVTVLTGVDSVTLYYRGHRGLVAEVLHFGASGKVTRAFAHYAQPPG